MINGLYRQRDIWSIGNWSAGQLINGTIDQQDNWSTGQLINGTIDQQDNWSTGQLTNGIVDQWSLIKCPADQMTCAFRAKWNGKISCALKVGNAKDIPTTHPWGIPHWRYNLCYKMSVNVKFSTVIPPSFQCDKYLLTHARRRNVIVFGFLISSCSP